MRGTGQFSRIFTTCSLETLLSPLPPPTPPLSLFFVQTLLSLAHFPLLPQNLNHDRMIVVAAGGASIVSS